MKVHPFILCGLAGLLLAPAECLAIGYSISELGTVDGFAAHTYPYAINNKGQVVGDAYSGATMLDPYHAFLYRNGTIQDLQTLGGTNSAARGINQAGQVVGWSDFPASAGQPALTQAFVYDGSGLQSLGGLIPGGASNGFAINNAGEAVGIAAALVGGHIEKDVFLYSGGSMNDLGNFGLPAPQGAAVTGINDSDQIAGYHFIAGNGSTTQAFIVTNGVLHDIGTLGGITSSAAAINNDGQVAGAADLDAGGSHAFLYDGTIHDLGSLGTGNSYASGLNSLGQVVGSSTGNSVSHAFLYAGGPMLDLNSLIDPAGGWVLTSAAAINDVGQITGVGTFNGQERAYLLTPAPEPASLAMAGMGFASFVLCVARQLRRDR